jgi:hypothetical protein
MRTVLNWLIFGVGYTAGVLFFVPIYFLAIPKELLQRRRARRPDRYSANVHVAEE